MLNHRPRPMMPHLRPRRNQIETLVQIINDRNKIATISKDPRHHRKATDLKVNMEDIHNNIPPKIILHRAIHHKVIQLTVDTDNLCMANNNRSISNNNNNNRVVDVGAVVEVAWVCPLRLV